MGEAEGRVEDVLRMSLRMLVVKKMVIFSIKTITSIRCHCSVWVVLMSISKCWGDFECQLHQIMTPCLVIIELINQNVTSTGACR